MPDGIKISQLTVFPGKRFGDVVPFSGGDPFASYAYQLSTLLNLGKTGLTGGGTANLDGTPTVEEDELQIWNVVTTGNLMSPYQLQTSTAAQNSPNIIRPLDFDSGNNPKVFQILGYKGLSLTITGEAGAGFAEFLAQSGAPSTPSGATRLYADASYRPSWIQPDGYTRTLSSTLTASRVYTLPDAAGTFILNTNPAGTTLTNVNSITSTAGANLVLATGTFGTAVTIASATGNVTLTPAAGVGQGVTVDSTDNTAANSYGFRFAGSSATSAYAYLVKYTAASAGALSNAVTLFSGNNGNIRLDAGSGSVLVTSSTVSSSTITGALVVSGGVGIAGATYIAGGLNITSSSVSVLSSIASSTSRTYIWQGNASGSAYQQNVLNIQPTTGSVGTHFTKADGTSVLYVDAANGAVGVNTTTPTASSLTIAYATASSSTSTGSLINAGGFGNAGAVWFGSTLNLNGQTNTSYALNVLGGARFNAIAGGVNQSCTIIEQSGTGSAGRILIYNAAGTPKIILDAGGTSTFADTTASTSTTTGSGVFGGGIGVAGAIYGGGTGTSLYTLNTTVLSQAGLWLGQATPSSTNYQLSGDATTTYMNAPTTMRLRVNNVLASGLVITASAATFGTDAPLTVSNATASTSSTTGALVVSGGAGFAKDVWVNGVRVGLGNGAGATNTVLGTGTGASITTGARNTFLGYGAGNSVTVGNDNTLIGQGAGQTSTLGTSNTFIGSGVGFGATTGATLNTVVGAYAAASLTTGESNTLVGYAAGNVLTTGSNNTLIGRIAGFSVATSGSGNVMLGFSAGRYETGSNTFYVDNQDRTNTAGDKAGALLYGTFNATVESQTLTINAGTVAIGKATGAASSHHVTRRSGGSYTYRILEFFNNDGGLLGYVGGNSTDTLAGYQTLFGLGNFGVAGDGGTYVVGTTSASLQIKPSGTLTVGTTSTGAATFANTTASTLTTNGALVVAGGVGIGGSINAGGTIVATGNISGALLAGTSINITPTNATDIAYYSNVPGGSANRLYVMKNNGTLEWGDGTAARDTFLSRSAAGTLSVTATTASTGSTSGALVVSGGAGFAKDIWIGTVRVGNGNGQYGSNTAIGQSALNAAAGDLNLTAVGANALVSNTNGVYNTAVGVSALATCISGQQNTAVGWAALNFATSNGNSAFGTQALYTLTSGAGNVAIGSLALLTNSTGSGNVAIGSQAGRYETGSDTFYVDNRDRTNLAGGRAGALLYGTFNSTPASQTLAVNAALTAISISSPGAGSQSERFGYGASTSTYTNGVAVGYGATITGNLGVAVGYGASTGDSGVSVGYVATGASFATTIGRAVTNNYTSLLIGYNIATTANGQIVFGGGDAYTFSDVYIGRGITHTSVTSAVTIQPSGASGTDVAGADIKIAGAKATGNAAGGSILFQTSDAGSPGATLQSLSTKLTLTAAGNLQFGADGTYIAGTSTNQRIAFSTASSTVVITAGNATLASFAGTGAVTMPNGTLTVSAYVYAKNADSAFALQDGSGNNKGKFGWFSNNTYLDFDGTLNLRAGYGGSTVASLSAAGSLALGGVAASASTSLIMPAGTTGVSTLRIPHGAAPTSPVDGDMWTTTAGLFIRINGATVGPLS